MYRYQAAGVEKKSMDHGGRITQPHHTTDAKKSSLFAFLNGKKSKKSRGGSFPTNQREDGRTRVRKKDEKPLKSMGATSSDCSV
jgi:hypothetical protein